MQNINQLLKKRHGRRHFPCRFAKFFNMHRSSLSACVEQAVFYSGSIVAHLPEIYSVGGGDFWEERLQALCLQGKLLTTKLQATPLRW